MSWWGEQGRTNPTAREREAKALAFVQEFVSTNGYGPSIRQIAAGIGVKSSATAHRAVTQLRFDGKLTMLPSHGCVQVKA